MNCLFLLEIQKKKNNNFCVELFLITFLFTSTGVWKSRTKFNIFRGAQDKKNTRVADNSILSVLFLLAIILTCLWLVILDNRSTCKELDILNSGWNELITKIRHVLLEIDVSNNTSRSKILDNETYKRVENTLMIWGPILWGFSIDDEYKIFS